MDVPRILSFLILLACIFGTTSSLNKEPAGPNFVRRGRRISLNEYLVPPPPPRHFPGRTGRLANPSPTDAPGYFSKLMNWFNPFGIGASHSPPPIPPPRPDTLHPPPPKYPPPQPPRGPPLNPPPGFHTHPPPGSHINPPPGSHINQPPGPHINPPTYHAPPPPSYERHQFSSSPTNNHGQYLPPTKGKTCNPCNKVPWIPMEGNGHHPEHVFSGSYQHSGGYLPPNNQNHGHDVHPAASHEVRAPDFSQVRLQQNGHPPLISPLPNPHLYPGPMPPLYKAEPFERPLQVSHGGNGGYVEPPPLSVGPVEGNHNYGPPPSQEYGNVNIGNQGYGQFGGHGNQDLTSSGTHANKDYQSAISQNQEFEFNKGHVDHNQSLDSSAPGNEGPNSGVPGYQGYLGPSANNQEFDGNLGHSDIQGSNSGVSGYQGYQESSINNQEFNGNLGHSDNQGPNSGASGYEGHPGSSANKQEFEGNLGPPGQDNPNLHASYGSSSLGSNSGTYQGSFESNSGHGSDLDHLAANSNPPSFGSSSFDIHTLPDSNGLHRQHPDDLTSSGSVVQDSHANVQTSSVSSSSSSNENTIHFEQSPLLDLSKKGESRNEFLDTGETTQTTAGYNTGTDNAFFEDQFGARPTESYFSSDHVQNLDVGLETTTSAVIVSPNGNGSGGSSTLDDSRQDASYIPPSGQSGFLWPSLLTNILKDNFTEEANVLGNEGEAIPKDANRTLPKQQNVKRNKQVQVIIPYTSEYTPIPFQLSYGDWSVKNNVERTQPRKVPQPSELNSYNYLSQESRNEIQAINKLESGASYGPSNDPNIQSTTPLSIVTPETRGSPAKANSSIDVRRLQKNIDNWTIQEYSSATTSSTILPSSLRPYLQPSKKIPDEYLTTTESADRANNGGDIRESVKTYSLAGFSFNDLDHEVSASNRVEGARVQVIRVEDLKSSPSIESNKTVSTTEEEVTWKEFSVSISPLNKERVYVVTPQSVSATPKGNFEKEKKEREGGNSRYSSKSIANDGKKSKSNLDEFEAIERAYQVLPQAVNNLAVASTAKENVPLWGIMEHGEFASLNVEEDEETEKGIVDGPVLYSGHSKVSRARR